MGNGFLAQVAKYLKDGHQHDFKDLVLVFPNRRSIAYFNDALKSQLSETVWFPKTVTIASFLESFTEYTKGSQIQLLFELYKAYAQASNSKESFDDFFHWGEVLLNDFDDVDKYMANHKAVFANVKDMREMERTLDFLTEEQVQVLKAFFKSFDENKYSNLQKSFFEVWEVLAQIYEQFNQSLIKKGIAYEGAIYRNAVDTITNSADYKFNQVAFVGFNAITKCEEKIFQHFKNQNKAMFFWDYDAFYSQDEHQEAGLFVRKYLKMFSMPQGFYLKSDILNKSKQISVHSAPTNHGQIEIVGRDLQHIKTEKQSDVAVVLADEGMLFPMLNNLPGNISCVNTTMGYPIMESNIGALVDLLIQLQQNIRINSKGEVLFYHKYVVRLLRHPLILKFSEGAITIIDEIVAQNLFYIAAQQLETSSLFKKIFQQVESYPTFHQYLSAILCHFIEAILSDKDNYASHSFDLEFIYATFKANNQLFDELKTSAIEIQLPTYFQLFVKLLKSTKVPFEGEPLRGLQLMGFLETRNLDFEVVYILSVNEGLLPSNQHRTSFIPYNLRKGFGLPTTEMHDAMYAYYFYRMLQRSKKVHLIYNAGSSGMRTGEKSRFIQQLVFGTAFDVEEKVINQSLSLPIQEKNQIQKSEKVQAILKAYIAKDSTLKLSPSALSRYLQCQIRFFYHTVLKVYEQDEVEEHVDARLFGNLFHVASEFLYSEVLKSKQLVGKEYIDGLMKDEHIDAAIQLAFNEVFKLSKKKTFNIEGKNVLVKSVLNNYLKQLLYKDREIAPFSMVGIEEKMYEKIAFSFYGERVEVLIGGLVDRIDRTEKALRIVDYKTGSDKLTFKTLEDVFDAEKIKDHKAIFQTFLYGLVYAKKYPNEPVITPMVYQVKEFFVPQSNFNIVASNEPAFVDGNFKSIQKEANEYISRLLSEIFDFSLPFTETPDEKQCTYCSYKMLCGKQ